LKQVNKQNGNHKNRVFYATISSQTNTSHDSLHQQLTMTSTTARTEQIEDGLATGSVETLHRANRTNRPSVWNICQ